VPVPFSLFSMSFNQLAYDRLGPIGIGQTALLEGKVAVIDIHMDHLLSNGIQKYERPGHQLTESSTGQSLRVPMSL